LGLGFAAGSLLGVGTLPLLFLFVHDDGLQIFGLNDQTAVEAFDIIDTVAAGNDYGTVMLANGRHRLHGLHKADYGFILTMSLNLSSPKIKDFYLRNQRRLAPAAA
jgi:hypothetical protein